MTEGLRRSGASPFGSVALLIAASACSFTDRQIMSLLVEPIQADLGISDTGVSLLLGAAFVSCYALAGPPLGLLVDRRRRWSIISLGIAAWSVATAACAFAGSFVQFFLCRMGVGIGEATLNPAAYSLLPDLVPANRLGLAIAGFGLGVYAGAGLALLIGGQIIGLLTATPTFAIPLVGAIASWKAVFLVVATLGAPLALIAWFMREPDRSGCSDASPVSVGDVGSYLRARAAPLVLVTLMWSFILMAGYALGAWIPAYMMRTFEWSAQRVGLWFGLVIVVLGGGGALTGGWLSDRLSQAREGGRVLVVAVLAALALPFAALLGLASEAPAAIGLVAGFVFLQAGAASAAPTALQDILPAKMRGVGSALAIAVTVMLGLGLGPVLVALVTDYVFGDQRMLGRSLSLVLPIMLVGCLLTGLASLRWYGPLSRELRGDVE